MKIKHIYITILLICILLVIYFFWRNVFFEKNISIIEKVKLGKEISKLTCGGIGKQDDIYQLDCLFPNTKRNFVMKENLMCKLLTNHQMSDLYDEILPDKYLVFTTLKTDDYRTVRINIDKDKNIIKRTGDPGEFLPKTLKVTTSDTNVILATALEIKTDEHIKSNTSLYEYMLIDKKTGWGLISDLYITDLNGLPMQKGMKTDYMICD